MVRTRHLAPYEGPYRGLTPTVPLLASRNGVTADAYGIEGSFKGETQVDLGGHPSAPKISEHNVDHNDQLPSTGDSACIALLRRVRSPANEPARAVPDTRSLVFRREVF